MPRNARDAAYIWASEEAELIQLHDVAAIMYVPEEDPGRFLFEVIFPPDAFGAANEIQIAGYFGVASYSGLSREYVFDFVDGAKAMWDKIAGYKPPPGWEC
jgi:hypothetical protein